ncbi:MAG: hypothetical protein ACM3UL_04295 [Ignavibacteria bacterium]
MVKMIGLSQKQKQIRLTVIVIFVLMLSASITFPLKAEAQTGGYYDKSYAWEYKGQHWTWNLSIPIELYNAYKSVPVSTRTQDGPAGYGFCTTTQDAYVKTLAQQLNETAKKLGFNSFDTVSFALAFVQSLPYTSDSVTTGRDEYPRFPIETLVDDGGDCEDTSILFATITILMGYGTVYINPPDHYAVGILGNNLPGTYWTYPEGSNRTYYYCETTGNNFMIGDLPDEFKGQSAYIYPIDENKQYIPPITLAPPITPSPTESPVSTVPDDSIQPTPNDSTSPTIPGPSIEPVLPLSFNLISDNPLFFVLIMFAIIVSIGIAVWSVRKPKRLPKDMQMLEQPSELQEEASDFESNKFCIYCGSNNKTYASFCEKCGKQMASS